jgi:hypothetical protein
MFASLKGSANQFTVMVSEETMEHSLNFHRRIFFYLTF